MKSLDLQQIYQFDLAFLSISIRSKVSEVKKKIGAVSTFLTASSSSYKLTAARIPQVQLLFVEITK